MPMGRCSIHGHCLFQGFGFEGFQLFKPDIVVGAAGLGDSDAIARLELGEGEVQEPGSDGVCAGPVHILKPLEEGIQVRAQLIVGTGCQDLGTGLPMGFGALGEDGLEEGGQIPHLGCQLQTTLDAGIVFLRI